MSISASQLAERRRKRTRARLLKVSKLRHRLSVYRSSRHIYVQVIDDTAGCTLAQASSKDKAFKGSTGSNVDAASEVGKLVAERAMAIGIKSVVFDRGSYIFHGRVKALAESAREGGLNF